MNQSSILAFRTKLDSKISVNEWNIHNWITIFPFSVELFIDEFFPNMSLKGVIPDKQQMIESIVECIYFIAQNQIKLQMENQKNEDNIVEEKKETIVQFLNNKNDTFIEDDDENKNNSINPIWKMISEECLYGGGSSLIDTLLEIKLQGKFFQDKSNNLVHTTSSKLNMNSILLPKNYEWKYENFSIPLFNKLFFWMQENSITLLEWIQIVQYLTRELLLLSTPTSSFSTHGDKNKNDKNKNKNDNDFSLTTDQQINIGVEVFTALINVQKKLNSSSIPQYCNFIEKSLPNVLTLCLQKQKYQQELYSLNNNGNNDKNNKNNNHVNLSIEKNNCIQSNCIKCKTMCIIQ